MRSSKIIHVVSCHAEGEVGDVIVGGVVAPPGDTLWEQSRFIARDGGLRDFVLNEPRGGVFRHVNLLVPAKDPRAQIGFIIMEPEDTPPMSGSNSICVATVLLDTGILPMQEPETRLTLEAPGGVIGIVAECRDGKAERISVENVPSFADRLDAPLEVAKSRNADASTSLTAATVSSSSTPGRLGSPSGRTRRANWPKPASESPPPPTHSSAFAIPKTRTGITSPSASSPVRSGARAARSPARTPSWSSPARSTARRPEPDAAPGWRRWRREARCRSARSIAPAPSSARNSSAASPARRRSPGGPAIVPVVSGRAWITGVHQHMLDPSDPWPRGYRLADTWPAGRSPWARAQGTKT